MWRLALCCTMGVATIGAMSPEVAEAAGYALKEQSTTAQGNAFAGATAGADDVSFMFFNPAALGWIARPEARLEAVLLQPRIELERSSGSTSAGTPITGREHDGNVAKGAVVPAFYLAAPVMPLVTAGIGVNVPFGLETEYRRNWVGRYHGVQSKLEAININPALAWRPFRWLSMGGGFQAQYVDGRLTNAIDFGTIGAERVPNAQPGAQDGLAKLRGNDWSYGANAGVMVEPLPGTRLGLAWRSQIQHRLKGRVNFRDDDAGIARTIRQSNPQLFTNSSASLDLDTPQSVSFGLRQAITSDLDVMAEVQWTDWSAFDQLTVEFDNPAQPDNVTEEEWHDSWFFALGSTYRLDPAWTLRGGIAFDQAPVRTRYRTPRIPDANRYWLSVGAGYEPNDWLGFNLGLTYIFLDDSRVRLRVEDPTTDARGNLDADYESSIILLGLSARLRF